MCELVCSALGVGLTRTSKSKHNKYPNTHIFWEKAKSGSARADLQVLVAGRDSLAVDLTCCQLVGVQPCDIPHLKLALEHLGKPPWTLVGEDIGMIKQFRLPEQKALYRFIFWLMYLLDYPYSWMAERGRHLCTTLYNTGLVGTRPQINKARCTRCGICVEACPQNAISVKGYSGTRTSP
jgi:NAD-dependent dihydropyrimidine dehydrogenase PreA subunit